jgi:hypothetical protein
MTHLGASCLDRCVLSAAAGVATISRDVPESASGIIALDAIESPIVKQGLAYWTRLKGERDWPTRADMSPKDMAPLLRNIVLLRRTEDHDYEFRIVGDAHVISHGFSMQGLKVSGVDQISPGYGTVLKSLYDHVVHRQAPFAFRGWMERGGKVKQYIYSESVFMPLGPDGHTIDHVLNFSVYIPRDRFDG